MKRRKALTRSRSRSLGFAGSCQRPSYGRVLGSDLAFAVMPILGALVGGAAGAALAPGAGPQKAFGAALGGVAGYVAGFVPGFYVQRHVLRSPDCKDPATGKIITYDVVKTGLAAGARAVGNAIGGNAGNTLALASVFAAPLIGQKLLHE